MSLLKNSKFETRQTPRTFRRRALTTLAAVQLLLLLLLLSLTSLTLDVGCAGRASAYTPAYTSAPQPDTVWVHPASEALLNGDTVHVHMFVLVGPYRVDSFVGGAQYRLEGQAKWTDTPPLYDEHQVMDVAKLPTPHPFTGMNWVQGYNIVFSAPATGAVKVEYRVWAAAATVDGANSIRETTGSLSIRTVAVDSVTSAPIQVSPLIAKAYTDGIDTHVHLVVDFYPPSQALTASAWIRTNLEDAWAWSGAVSQFEHFFDPVSSKLYSRYNLSWKIAHRALSSLSYMISVRDGQGAKGASDAFEVRVVPIHINGMVVPPDNCTAESVSPLLSTLFASLGNDCETYASLYASDALYYHQHDGFKNASQLLANCQGYAKFCPPGTCTFQQNGMPSVVQGSMAQGTCRILAPYLWAELPANNKVPGNMEPHTGWEYIEVVADASARFGYKIKVFAEVETSYSVALNWGMPNDTSVYDWTTQLLSSTASRGECSHPVAPLVTDWMHTRSKDASTLWRQQGDAVVLAAGGLCHMVVPYAADVGQLLQTGNLLFVLKKNSIGYSMEAPVVDFQTPVQSTQPPTPGGDDDGDDDDDAGKKMWFIVAVASWAITVVACVYAAWLWKQGKDSNADEHFSMSSYQSLND
jgi:hypothetical protein